MRGQADAGDEGLATALSKLDSDGNHSLSASELTAAIDAFSSAHHHAGAASAGQSTTSTTA